MSRTGNAYRRVGRVAATCPEIPDILFMVQPLQDLGFRVQGSREKSGVESCRHLELYIARLLRAHSPCADRGGRECPASSGSFTGAGSANEDILNPVFDALVDTPRKSTAT